MREAIGGTLLVYLIIPIFLLFIMFVGFVMNYAAAYRSANYIVENIETCQSMSDCTHTSMSKLKEDVKQKYGYNGDVDCTCSTIAGEAVCGVVLKVGMDLPFLGRIDYFSVKTETKAMYGFSGSSMCD